MAKMKISEIEAYATLEKVVTAAKGQGKLSTPVAWSGKRVLILLLDPMDE